MPRFSRRTDHDREPNAWARALERRRRAGLPVCDLTESNPTRVGLHYPEQDLLAALADPHALHYAPSALGLEAAREAVAELYSSWGFGVGHEQVLLTASTSEAYAFLFKLLCDPGDELLVPTPSYPLFEPLSAFEAVRTRSYALHYDGAWYLDFGSLERALNERTRAIVVVTPNNPTGSFLKRDELERLSSFGLPIISDEVFGAYSFCEDARRARSALEARSGLRFVLGGLSKLALLPQLKLAWTVVSGPDAEVAEALARLGWIGDAFLSPSTPTELALPKLLALASPLRAALSARLRHNLSLLQRALSGSAATLLHAEGGWYALLKLPALLDDGAWAELLLEQDGILTQPGHFYDISGGPHLVLSLLPESGHFGSAAIRLAARVASVVGG